MQPATPQADRLSPDPATILQLACAVRELRELGAVTGHVARRWWQTTELALRQAGWDERA